MTSVVFADTLDNHSNTLHHTALPRSRRKPHEFVSWDGLLTAILLYHHTPLRAHAPAKTTLRTLPAWLPTAPYPSLTAHPHYGTTLPDCRPGLLRHLRPLHLIWADHAGHTYPAPLPRAAVPRTPPPRTLPDACFERNGATRPPPCRFTDLPTYLSFSPAT